jgi:aquaporin Z
VAIGGTIAICALMGGPVSGASLNPARSLAPALLSGTWGAQWIYLLAPPLGAAAAHPCCRIIQGRACCDLRRGGASPPPAEPSTPDEEPPHDA